MAVVLGETAAGWVRAGVADGRGEVDGVVPGAGRLLCGLAAGRGEWLLPITAGNGVASVRIGATAYPRPEGRATAMPATADRAAAVVAVIAISR